MEPRFNLVANEIGAPGPAQDHSIRAGPAHVRARLRRHRCMGLRVGYVYLSPPTHRKKGRAIQLFSNQAIPPLDREITRR